MKLLTHKTLMNELTKDAGAPEGELAKAINIIMVLMYGIPAHQKIVQKYIHNKQEDGMEILKMYKDNPDH